MFIERDLLKYDLGCFKEHSYVKNPITTPEEAFSAQHLFQLFRWIRYLNTRSLEPSHLTPRQNQETARDTRADFALFVMPRKNMYVDLKIRYLEFPLPQKSPSTPRVSPDLPPSDVLLLYLSPVRHFYWQQAT